jgi:hypothetical protein
VSDDEKIKFWNGLARLYDESLALKESIRELAATSKPDGENIRALARIAEIHERRLSDLDEPPQVR